MRRSLAVLSWWLLAAPMLVAQPPLPGAGPMPPPDTLPADPAVPPPPQGEIPEDPWGAYDAGYYDRALQGFVDLQVENPEEPSVLLNVASAHYRMRDYAAADQAFATAAQSGDPGIRAQALYGLGNSAYRQGRLGEAVELYKAVLEADPDDADAKFNLEFVRDEIRRRHEEAQKRQQEQPQEPEPESQDGQQQQPEPQEGAEAQDSDRDGLPDDLERQGENPTDPENPDTDGDGLADGQEDQNRNGRLDDGETDPNRADSDGDGVPDGAAAEPASPQGEEDPQGLTPEEAERYLQALGEDRPPLRPHPESGKSRRLKDW